MSTEIPETHLPMVTALFAESRPALFIIASMDKKVHTSAKTKDVDTEWTAWGLFPPLKDQEVDAFAACLQPDHSQLRVWWIYDGKLKTTQQKRRADDQGHMTEYDEATAEVLPPDAKGYPRTAKQVSAMALNHGYVQVFCLDTTGLCWTRWQKREAAGEDLVWTPWAKLTHDG